MNLKDAALAASKEQSDADRDRRTKEREESLTRLLEGTGYGDKPVWDAQWHFEPIPDKPARDTFVFCKRREEGYRGSELSGWQFILDDVPFLYSTTQTHSGMYVLLTCPDCGAVRANHFYSLEVLGNLIKRQVGIGHTCLETEARELAYAIGRAAQGANTTPAAIVEHAMHEHVDTMLKGLGR